MRRKILHIAVHLGGGIGSVLRGWIERDKENDHEILCLNETINSVQHPKIKERLRGQYDLISTEAASADIVLIHFWNHPFLFELLANIKLPPCRVCFWSHVSGLNAPYVFSEELIEYTDAFVFSSPISFEATEIKELPIILRNRLRTIWTTGDVEEFLRIEKTPHDTFNVGCVGTLDYSKLHPNFVDMCSKINIPNVHFIVCGGGCDEQRIKNEVKARGLESKFTFTGILKDVKPLLSIMDVFGYPLNPTHFGTCEQVIGEAMAAGIIPITMKNPAEEFILYKSFSKFVSPSEEAYVRNIEAFYADQQRVSVIDEMQNRVRELYNTETMISEWNKIFCDVQRVDKKERAWPVCRDRSGHELFILSVGMYAGDVLAFGTDEEIRELFNTNLQWKSSSKGSVLQYLKAFPQDKQLQRWSKLI